MHGLLQTALKKQAAVGRTPLAFQTGFRINTRQVLNESKNQCVYEVVLLAGWHSYRIKKAEI